MERRLRSWVRQGASATVLCVAGLTAVAQDDVSSAAQELVERERIRSGVEAAFAIFRQPASTGEEYLDHAAQAVDALVALGPEAVPYLVNELEQENIETYEFSAWALGMIPGPASEEGLRAGVARAELDRTSGAGFNRKGICCWALGLHGRADAIELLNSGHHHAAHWPIHTQTPVIEIVAAFTAPESQPILLEQLALLGADEARQLERRPVLRALRRLADPRSVPAIAALIDDPHAAIRHEAVLALGTHVTPESRDALLRALADAEPLVRRMAAIGLDQLRLPDLPLAPLLERLEVETDALTRGALYRLVARGDRESRERLYSHADRPDPLDRQLLIEALAPRADRRDYELLERALVDRDNAVGLAAVEALSRIGTRESEKRLAEAVPRVSWTVAQILAERVGDSRNERAAPAVAERLLAASSVSANELASAVITSRELARALVRIGHHQAAPKLHAAAEELAQRAAPGTGAAPEALELLEIYRRTAAELDRIRDLGSSVEAWAGQLALPDANARALAMAQLAKNGTDPAVRALVTAFDTAPMPERERILQELTGVDTPAARALIERLLLDPAFDEIGQRGLRDWAAWNARVLGGEPMREALAAAVERRGGRDVRVLFYAALLEPARVELLERYRLPRMRYLGHERGLELEALDWLVRYLAAGQSVAKYDAPPSRLRF